MGSIADLLAAQGGNPASAQVEPSGGSGPLGFVSNFVGDVKDAAVGLTALGGNVLHDLGRGVGQAIPGKQSWGLVNDTDPSGYHLDDIAKALPGVIASDYATRYGGASNIAHGLYEHPLSYLLDALMVGGLAGSAATKVGTAGIKASEEAITAAGGAATQLAEAGAKTGSIVPAATKIGLQALKAERPLTVLEGLAEKILPSTKYATYGSDVVDLKLAAKSPNPVTRALMKPLEKYGSQPIKLLEDQADELRAAISNEQRVSQVLAENAGTLAPAPEGYTRLYRGANVEAPVGAGQRTTYWSTDLADAKDYAANAEQLLGDSAPRDLYYRDVPTDELAAYKSEALDAGINEHPNHYELPTTEADMHPLSSAVQKSHYQRSLESQLENVQGNIEKLNLIGQKTFEKPFISEQRMRSFIKNVAGQAQNKGYSVRNQDFARIAEWMRPILKDNPELAEKGGTITSGLDTALVGAGDTANWAWHPDVTGTVTLGAKPESFLADIDPVVREAATAAGHEKLLARADDAITAARKHVEDFPQEKLTELGISRDQLAGGVDRWVDAVANSVKTYLDPEVPGSENLRATTRLLEMTDEARRLDMGDSIYHMMQRTMRPLQYRYGGVINKGAQTIDDIMVGAPKWEDIYDSFRAAGKEPPAYFAFTKETPKPSLMDFLMNRKRVGAVAAAADPHEKFFGGRLLETGNFIQDPMQAAIRRSATLNKFEMSVRYFNSIRDSVGRQVLAGDEISPAEVLMSPDDVWGKMRSSYIARDALERVQAEGPDAFGSVADDLKGMIHSNIDEVMDKFDTLPELIAIPKNVANQLESYSKYAGILQHQALRLFWDKPMSVWRSFVLGASPRWTVNNIVSNQLFLMLEGGRTRDVTRIAFERFKNLLNEKLKTNLNTDLLETLRTIPGLEDVGSGFTSHGLQAGDLGFARDTKTGKFYGKLSEAGGRGKRVATGYVRTNVRLNEAAEQTWREASYLTELDRQTALHNVQPAIKMFESSKSRIERLASQAGETTPGQMRAAYDGVNRAMGNYGNLGPIERNIWRRFVMPFWAYYRHQARLLLSMPFEHPVKAQLLQQIAAANDEVMKIYGPLPDYLKGAVPMGLPGESVPFFNSRGTEPFAASFDSPVQMLHPFIKVLLERAQGRNSFTDQPFTDPNVIRNFGSEQAFRKIYDEQGNVVDVEPIEGDVLPGIGEQLLRNFPQYSMAENLLGGGRQYDTTNIFNAATGSGTVIDPETGLPKYPTDAATQLGGFIGTPIRDYDLKAYQDWIAEQQRIALASAIKQATGG